MNKFNLRIVLLAMPLALVLGGCQTTPVQEGAFVGGALGAGLGAVVGNQTGNAGNGALIGAGVGAITGALVGDAVNSERQMNQQQNYETPQVQVRPVPAPVQNVPPVSGNAYHKYEYRVVQGANGETYEQRVLTNH